MRRVILATVGLVLLFAGLSAAVVILQTRSASPGAAASSGLTCSVKASCAAGEVEVLRMSSLTNAHAGTASASAYGYAVCCGGVSRMGTQCTGVYDVALTLSGPDNAHAASDGSYGTDVCLSGYGDDATAHVTYGPSCDAGYACLATISGSTNAHVADCDGVNDYATKVCGLVTPDNCPSTSNPGQENADGDRWGDACDNCSTTATPWYVPPADGDCDGFRDTEEAFVGTDAADACPDNVDDDAWPADLASTLPPPDSGYGKHDGKVNILDIVQVTPPYFNTSPPDPNYSERKDFNGDGKINILDIIRVTPPTFNTSCTP